MSPPRPAPCPACGEGSLSGFVDIESVPVFCNVLWPTAEAAQGAARGDIRLGYCARCTFIQNVAFDPELVAYSPHYESSLHFSPRFHRYATELARRLCDRHALRGRRVVEIGCGKGEFLALLRESGAGEAIGFDATYDPERLGPAAASIRVFRESYSAAHPEAAADLLVCRHVLEHVADPLAFLCSIRATLEGRGGGAVYFEVPNALYTLADLGIWDLIYEHCSYFTAPALARLFARAGFRGVEVTAAFDGQFLCVEAAAGQGRIGEAEEAGAGEIARFVERFAAERAAKIEHHRRTLAGLLAAGRRVAVWGIGSKGVTFLNVIPEASAVAFAIDLNPAKHGRFIAGTSLCVSPPEALEGRGAGDVLVMNPSYGGEIADKLAAMGVAARLHAV